MASSRKMLCQHAPWSRLKRSVSAGPLRLVAGQQQQPAVVPRTRRCTARRAEGCKYELFEEGGCLQEHQISTARFHPPVQAVPRHALLGLREGGHTVCRIFNRSMLSIDRISELLEIGARADFCKEAQKDSSARRGARRPPSWRRRRARARCTWHPLQSPGTRPCCRPP